MSPETGKNGNQTPMITARDLKTACPDGCWGRSASPHRPAFAADDPASRQGAAVTVLKAAKSCFANIVEVSGTIIPREETQIRPERMGLKVAEVMADAGDTVTAGQVLARLTCRRAAR